MQILYRTITAKDVKWKDIFHIYVLLFLSLNKYLGTNYFYDLYQVLRFYVCIMSVFMYSHVSTVKKPSTGNGVQVHLLIQV